VQPHLLVPLFAVEQVMVVGVGPVAAVFGTAVVVNDIAVIVVLVCNWSLAKIAPTTGNVTQVINLRYTGKGKKRQCPVCK
jgi:hypothetical protein